MTEPIESPRDRVGRTMILLALAWGIVGTPLVWGVFETVKKSISLFR
jgi:hypothetical protein